MAITVASILTTMRALLVDQDAASYRWTTAELVAYLNEGVRAVVSHRPDAFTVNEVVQLVAGAKQSVPANRLAVLDVRRNMGSDGLSPGGVITYVARNEMDMADPNWMSAAASATTLQYVPSERDRRTYYVYPPRPAPTEVPLILTGSADAPYLRAYGLTAGRPTLLAGLFDVMPGVAAFEGAWIELADGTVYFALALMANPFIALYKRAPGATTFTKLANPATLPAGLSRRCAFTPDGVYLAVAHDTTPFVTVYKRAGDVFTKIANPAVLPAGAGHGVSWAADGSVTLLAVGIQGGDGLMVYELANDVLTDAEGPGPSAHCYDVAYSPNGRYLAVANAASGTSIIVYKRNGTQFPTQIVPPGQTALVNHRGIGWNRAGDLLFAVRDSTAGASNVLAWDRAGDVFTKLADPVSFPTAAVAYAITTTEDDLYVLVGVSSGAIPTPIAYAVSGAGAARVLTRQPDAEDYPPTNGTPGVVAGMRTEGGAGYVEAVFSTLPADMTADGTGNFTLDDIYEPPVMHWALALAYSKDTDTADEAKANTHYRKFGDLLGVKLMSDRFFAPRRAAPPASDPSQEAG